MNTENIDSMLSILECLKPEGTMTIKSVKKLLELLKEVDKK